MQVESIKKSITKHILVKLLDTKAKGKIEKMVSVDKRWLLGQQTSQWQYLA